MSDESDIELPPIVQKTKAKKPPKSPTADMLDREPKKISTKVMIHEAMVELTTNNRKGVSLYAIKKYMVEKYNVDTDKIKYYIKKSIKLGVEDGTIVQTKGVGASGSFRLAPKKKTEKKSKEKTKKPVEKKMSEQPETITKMAKLVELSGKSEKTSGKKDIKKKDDNPKAKSLKKDGKKEKPAKKVEVDTVKTKGTKVKDSMAKDSKKTKDSKSSKESKTSGDDPKPAKKKESMKKRKSIGSIIKAPKMKPKVMT